MQSWGTPDEEPVGAKTALRKALSKFELCKQFVRYLQRSLHYDLRTRDFFCKMVGAQLPVTVARDSFPVPGACEAGREEMDSPDSCSLGEQKRVSLTREPLILWVVLSWL